MISTKGCGSWTWYYPYLYAPLCTDLKDLASKKIIFQQGIIFYFLEKIENMMNNGTSYHFECFCYLLSAVFLQ